MTRAAALPQRSVPGYDAPPAPHGGHDAAHGRAAPMSGQATAGPSGASVEGMSALRRNRSAPWIRGAPKKPSGSGAVRGKSPGRSGLDGPCGAQCDRACPDWCESQVSASEPPSVRSNRHRRAVGAVGKRSVHPVSGRLSTAPTGRRVSAIRRTHARRCEALTGRRRRASGVPARCSPTWREAVPRALARLQASPESGRQPGRQCAEP